MKYKINQDCVGCGACAQQCELNAIIESEDKYRIAPDKCTGCGNCKDVCPIEAIKAL